MGLLAQEDLPAEDQDLENIVPTSKVPEGFDDDLDQDELPKEGSEEEAELVQQVAGARNSLLEYQENEIHHDAVAHTGYQSTLSAHIALNLKAKLLSREQEADLFIRYKKGDQLAYLAIIEANLRMVVKIARRYHYTGMPMEDLISEGHFGLFKAIEKFKVELGFKFSTYAYNWVHQSITRAISNQSRVVRWPVHADQNFKRIQKIKAVALSRGEKVSVEEIAEEVGLNACQVEDLIKLYNREVSMQSEMTEGEDLTLETTLSNESDNLDATSFFSSDRSHELKVLFERVLTDREAFVLRMRFGLSGLSEHTLEEVGVQIGVTRERIRQIEAKALRKLRKRFALNHETAEDLV